MKKIYLLIVFFASITYTFAQNDADSLLNDLDKTSETTRLLPKRMLLSQRIFWGEKGLYRAVGIAPKLTLANREKELKIRRNMFKIHQAVGFLTAAGMITQGILGSRLYNPDTYSDKLKKIHGATATGVNVGYITTALMAFTAPPPLINRKGISNIKVHKYLSYIHLSAMISTNILGPKIKEDYKLKPYHRASAYTAVGAYLGSMIVLKFEF
ncbi:hypothetical protein EMA8858_01946 [Emticicia aquatica]|jgi:hypothetical protein|uniref:DUF4079 domain-containing protein n=1 Tax=Emticicia aquatica TaxID=1681835 RepID=A0ABN8ESC3_9BACT|nr:hypothetical protein [Emticicia aquatica]CAH0995819.1 hypothetical protein EMA8858_01946 [Emticicia aquatica]